METTTILNIVFVTLSCILTASFVIYLYKKSDSEGRMKILEIVKIFVEAAEQMFIGSGRGKEKKEYVINNLKKIGLSIDEQTLDAVIEAAVYELNSMADYLIIRESDKEE